MNRTITAIIFITVCLATSLNAQNSRTRYQRRPAALATVPSGPLPAPNYEFFSILDGQPKGFAVHHDTEVTTGRAVDVYVFSIEMQVMNSDGNLEPEGLIINNYFTAKAIQPHQAPNPNNAHDCGLWNNLILGEIPHDPVLQTWSYVEFTVAYGARMIQTNEDGAVWWSDDIECWGARDRFSPF